MLLLAHAPGAIAIEEPDRLWRVGSGALADKLYPTARQVLERFVARYPGDSRASEAWLLLGKTRLAQGDLLPALDALRRAQSFVPPPGRSQEAKFWEAETLARLDRYEEARAAYDTVVRTDAASPVAPDAVYGLAWLELAHDHPDRAVVWFRKLLEAWPTDPRVPAVTFALGRTLVDLKRYGEAVPLLTGFGGRYPGHPHAADALYLLGLTRLALGETAAGVADLRAFVAANPTHELVPAARRKIAEGVLAAGNRQELATTYRELMAEAPARAEGLYDAKTIAARLGREPEQKAAWERLRLAFPDHPLTRRAALEVAQTAFKRKTYSEAVALARAAKQSDEPDVRAAALLLLGDAEIHRKRYEAALEAFEAAVGPGAGRDARFRALAGRALAHEKLEHWTEALKLYREVAAESAEPELRRWGGESVLALGKAHLTRGELPLALEAFRRARDLTPPPGQSQEARFWEAEALARLKRGDEARVAFDAVLAADAASPFAPDAVYGLASLALEQRRWEPAVARLRELLLVWPDSPHVPDATFALARTLVELGHYQEAVPLLERFVARYPRQPRAADARYLLGSARLAVGQTSEGVADLRAFAAANPATELARVARRKIVDTLLQSGDRRALAAEYRTLMAAVPVTAEGLYDAGAIAAELGRAQQRDAAWNRLRQKFPNHELTRRTAVGLARAALERKKYAEAVGLARAAERSEDPETRSRAALVIGEADLNLQQYAAALQSFEAAAGPGAEREVRSRALAGRALAYEKLRRWPEALRLYQEVAASSPDTELRRWAQDRALAVKARGRSPQRTPAPTS